MEHSFDVDVAVKYGVNAAILLQNLYWWIQKNKANKRHYHDGTYWTYNTREAYTKLFPYMSERQVKTAMDKLIADGIVITGDYNIDRYKRPTWYAITENGFTLLQKCSHVDTEMSERESENVSTNTDISTTDISTVDKPNNKHTPRKSAAPVFADGFDDFWAAYPKPVAKQAAGKAWAKLKPDEELRKTILANIRLRMDGEWKDIEPRYIPNPATYLNQRRWEDEAVKTGQKVTERVYKDADYENDGW